MSGKVRGVGLRKAAPIRAKLVGPMHSMLFCWVFCLRGAFSSATTNLTMQNEGRKTLSVLIRVSTCTHMHTVHSERGNTASPHLFPTAPVHILLNLIQARPRFPTATHCSPAMLSGVCRRSGPRSRCDQSSPVVFKKQSNEVGCHADCAMVKLMVT